MGNLWIFNGAVTVSGQFFFFLMHCTLSQYDTEEIESVSERSVLQRIWMLFQVHQPRYWCQRPLSFNILAFFCYTLACTFSAACVCLHYAGLLCVRFCAWSIWLSVIPQPGTLTLVCVCVCVCSCKTGRLFSCLKRPLTIREIHQTHTHTHTDTHSWLQANNNGSRRRACTYSIITWEVSMVASTGSALQFLPALMHCRCDCSWWFSSSF